MYVLFGVFPIKLEFSEPFDISLVPRGHLVYMKIYISSISSRFSEKRARTTLFFSLSLGEEQTEIGQSLGLMLLQKEVE